MPAFFLASIVRFRCGIAVLVHTVFPANLPALSRIAHASFSSACLLTSVVPRSTIGGASSLVHSCGRTRLTFLVARGCVGLLKVPVARGIMVCGGPPIGETMRSRNHVQEHAPAPLAFPIAPCTIFSMKDESRISAGARTPLSTPLHNIAPRAAAFPCAALRALCRHAASFRSTFRNIVNIFSVATLRGQGQSREKFRSFEPCRNSGIPSATLIRLILHLQKFPFFKGPTVLLAAPSPHATCAHRSPVCPGAHPRSLLSGTLCTRKSEHDRACSYTDCRPGLLTISPSCLSLS